MPSVTKAVLFDMDDVLCGYSLPRRLAYLAEVTGLEADHIHKVIWDSGFDDGADEGRYTAEAYLEEFGARLGAPLSRAQWIAARAHAMDPFEEVLDMARRVGARVPIALLTNNGPLLKEALPEIFPQVLEIFGERAFCSYEFGASKPNPEVFYRLLARIGAEPADTLFIDDHESYVVSARAAGLQVHHFKEPAALRVDLSKRGLL